MILPAHSRVVLWGLREPTGDSFQHIWRHYAHALDRLGKRYVWLPDAAEANEYLRPRDLVFAVDVAAQHLGRPANRVDYLLHNIPDTHPVRDGLEPGRCVYLQVWTNDCADRGESWGPVRRWDKHSHVLYQPWGTNLLADEFMPPVFNPHSTVAAFVGSIWEGNGQGNVGSIGELKDALHKRGLRFDHHYGVSDAENAEIVRAARIAPAVTGRWQVEHEYLPCRVFKNVSYGALAVTNVPTFPELLDGAAISGSSIDHLIEWAATMGEARYLNLVRIQQEVVARDYTYVNSLAMIERAFEEIR